MRLTMRPIYELPWVRRERADSHFRKALAEIQALIAEDPAWTRQYETLAYGIEAAISLLDLIEDVESQRAGAA